MIDAHLHRRFRTQVICKAQSFVLETPPTHTIRSNTFQTRLRTAPLMANSPREFQNCPSPSQIT